MKSVPMVVIGTLALWTGCVMDAHYKVNRDTIPEALCDGWEITSPAEAGFHPDSIGRMHAMLMDESRYYNALGLLVVKNDTLVFESYPRDRADRDHYHHLQSVTKSFTSMITGICIDHGLIDSLDRTLHNVLPDRFPNDSVKRTITLRHLLTMRSGLLIDNSDFAYTILVEKPADPVSWMLGLPLYAHPGDSMYYRDCDPQLMAYVIQAVTGKTELQIARQHLFQPLGITDYHWESVHDGATSGAYGLHLRPRDMAKIGRMLAHHGIWQGERVLDSAWIALSTQPMVSTRWEGIEWQYGFYWWVLPEYQAFSACGHGGQFIFVIPHRKLVIVMISMPDTNDEYVGTSLRRFIELVRPILGSDEHGRAAQ